MKFSLPVPAGHEQLTVVQPLVTAPHAVPTAGTAGQEAGVQQTFGFGVVLHTVPATGQLHVNVAPHPSLKDPHASPPGWPGPIGTFPQLYGAPVGLLQPQVPTAPATAVEQTLPVAHPQLMNPPTPFGSEVPQLPA